jgi:hypothetical protein
MAAIDPEVTERECPECGARHMAAACDGCPVCIMAGAVAFWGTFGERVPFTPPPAAACVARADMFASTV